MRFFNKKTLFLLLIVVIIIAGVLLALNLRKNVIEEENSSSIQNEPIVQATTTPETKTYRNEEWGFEFEYPNDWVIEDDKSYSSFSKFVRMGAPSDKKYLIYYPSPPLVVNIVTLDFANSAFLGVDPVTSTVIIANTLGIKYEYEFGDVSEIVVVLPIGQYKMILGATKEYEDVFNDIVSSFKFIEK